MVAHRPDTKAAVADPLELVEVHHCITTLGPPAALKRRRGSNILAFGGAGFAASLIEHDLVDEYQLIVNPALLGSGSPIFGGLRQPLSLSLVRAESYDEGIVVLTDCRKRIESA